MDNKKIGSLLRMGMAGVAAAFAGGAMAVGAARYLPEDAGCHDPGTATQAQPVRLAPARRPSGPGLLV